MTRALTAVACVVLLVGACSSDDDGGPATSTSVSDIVTTSVASTSSTMPSPSTSTTGTTSSTSTTAQASASTAPGTTDPVPLESVIQALLDRYDAAVTTILTDPRVTSDPASPPVTAYLALFTPDSTFAQTVLASWAQDAAEGRSYRPGSGDSMIDSSLVEVSAVSDTEASFVMCSTNSLQVVDAAGNVIESSGGVVFVEGAAVLVDGQWLFRDLSQTGGDCPRPGSRT